MRRRALSSAPRRASGRVAAREGCVSSYTGYLIETLVTLFAVCGLAFVVLWGARRLGAGRASGPIELQGHLPLDGRRAIYLIKETRERYTTLRSRLSRKITSMGARLNVPRVTPRGQHRGQHSGNVTGGSGRRSMLPHGSARADPHTLPSRTFGLIRGGESRRSPPSYRITTTPSASIRAMSGTSRARSTRRTTGNARTTRVACSSPDASPRRKTANAP
jgi:hypothetical protein